MKEPETFADLVGDLLKNSQGRALLQETVRSDPEAKTALLELTEAWDRKPSTDFLRTGAIALDGAEWRRVEKRLRGVETLEKGTQAGRYVIIEPLGEGGMGMVYLAEDPELNRRVAIKVLHTLPGGSDGIIEARERLMKEARMLAQLSHAHVVSIHDVGTVNAQVFIAMEYVKGSDLSHWLEAQDRTWEEILEAFGKAGRGLEAAHERDLVHRDFKPQNVLISEDGAIRVADFGLAEDDGLPFQIDSAKSVTGTPAYMAPEQILNGRFDRQSDQFSFCVALWEALYKTRPYPGRSLAEISERFKKGSVSEIDPKSSVPPWIGQCLLKGLAIDPRDRWPSMGTLLDALADDPRLRRRRRTMGAIAGVMIVLSLGWGGFTWWQAERQAVVAQELGQIASEAELMMRLLQSLPLHDIRADRQRVRVFLDEIRDRMDQLGRKADGPGGYALGRAHLALGELEEAREELQRARESGYNNPRLASALGLTLAALYQQELEDLRLLSSPGLVAKRRRELREEFSGPAISLLQTGGAIREEESLYVKGLLAFLNDDLEGAEILSREATAEAPWLWESRMLEAAVHEVRADAAAQRGAWEEVTSLTGKAELALIEAADIAKSEPRPRLRRCVVLADMARIRLYWMGGSVAEKAESALASCDEALIADPSLAQAHRWKASAFLYLGMEESAKGDPRTSYNLAAAEAEKAHQLDPNDPEVYIPWCRAYGRRAGWESDKGVAAEETFRRAQELAEEGIRLAPGFASLHGSLGLTLMDWGMHRTTQGLSPRHQYTRGIEATKKASHLDPERGKYQVNLALFYQLQAEDHLNYGRDPLPSLKASLRRLNDALERNPRDGFSHRRRIGTLRLMARYQRILEGGDEASLVAARESIAESLRLMPGHLDGFWEAALLELEAAKWRLSRRESPESELAAAEKWIESSLKVDYSWDALELRARAEWIRVQHLRDRVKPVSQTRLSRIESILKEALEMNPNSLEVMLGLARLERFRAEDLRPQASLEHLSIALGYLNQVREISPEFPELWLEEGLVRWQRAPLLKNNQRIAENKKARELFKQAGELNAFFNTQIAAILGDASAERSR